MPKESAYQQNVSRMFEIRCFDPLTATENAADGEVKLTIIDPSGTAQGPYTATLKPGTAGTYRVIVLLDPDWPEGEYIGEWSYELLTNVYKPRFTFHAHLVEVDD